MADLSAQKGIAYLCIAFLSHNFLLSPNSSLRFIGPNTGTSGGSNSRRIFLIRRGITGPTKFLLKFAHSLELFIHLFIVAMSQKKLNIISRNTNLSLHKHTGKNMKFLSEKMLSILERLSEMFPGSSYQSRLDAYLSTKGITEAAQLENYIQQFNSHKDRYL